MTSERENQSTCSCTCPEIPITAIIGSVVGGLIILGIVNVAVWYVTFKKKVHAKENALQVKSEFPVVTFSNELEQATISNQYAKTPLNQPPFQNTANNQCDSKEEDRQTPDDDNQIRESILAMIPQEKKAAVYALASVMPKNANKPKKTETEVQIPSPTGSVDSFQTTTCDDAEPVYNEIDVSAVDRGNLSTNAQ